LLWNTSGRGPDRKHPRRRAASSFSGLTRTFDAALTPQKAAETPTRESIPYTESEFPIRAGLLWVAGRTSRVLCPFSGGTSHASQSASLISGRPLLGRKLGRKKYASGTFDDSTVSLGTLRQVRSVEASYSRSRPFSAPPPSRLPPAPLRVNASLRLATLGVDAEPLRRWFLRRAAAPGRAAY
jgi:hypothetical protein